jgi:hypothetical protein
VQQLAVWKLELRFSGRTILYGSIATYRAPACVPNTPVSTPKAHAPNTAQTESVACIFAFIITVFDLVGNYAGMY